MTVLHYAHVIVCLFNCLILLYYSVYITALMCNVIMLTYVAFVVEINSIQFNSTLSLPLFPFLRGEVLPATSSPPHLIVYSTLLCLFVFFFLQSSSYPAFLTSHSPPVSALASLVSSCHPHVTLPLSSVVCHPPSFLRVLPTVICSSQVSLSSS